MTKKFKINFGCSQDISLQPLDFLNQIQNAAKKKANLR
jgi:hypothetical protein